MKAVRLASILLVSVTVGIAVVHAESASAKTIHASELRARSVAVVGDSLSWQATPSLVSAFSAAGYTAQVAVNPGHALSSAWTQDTLAVDLRGGSYGVIVLETASNDVVRLASGAVSISQYSQLLDQMIAEAGTTSVVIVNAKVDAPFYYTQSDALAINRVIDLVAEEHANVHVVDWNSDARDHPSWFGPDMLHLSPGLPATVLAGDPPNAAAQGPADTAFAQAILTGVASFAA